MASATTAADVLYGRFTPTLRPHMTNHNWRDTPLNLDQLGLDNYFEELQGLSGELFSGTEHWGAAVPLLPDAWCDRGNRYYLEPENPLSETYRSHLQLVCEAAQPDFSAYTDLAVLTTGDNPELITVSSKQYDPDGRAHKVTQGQAIGQHILAVEYLALSPLDGERRWVFSNVVPFLSKAQPPAATEHHWLIYQDANDDMIGWVRVHDQVC